MAAGYSTGHCTEHKVRYVLARGWGCATLDFFHQGSGSRESSNHMRIVIVIDKVTRIALCKRNFSNGELWSRDHGCCSCEMLIFPVSSYCAVCADALRAAGCGDSRDGVRCCQGKYACRLHCQRGEQNPPNTPQPYRDVRDPSL